MLSSEVQNPGGRLWCPLGIDTGQILLTIFIKNLNSGIEHCLSKLTGDSKSGGIGQYAGEQSCSSEGPCQAGPAGTSRSSKRQMQSLALWGNNAMQQERLEPAGWEAALLCLGVLLFEPAKCPWSKEE